MDQCSDPRGIESLSSITKQVRGCKVDQEDEVVKIPSINSDLIVKITKYVRRIFENHDRHARPASYLEALSEPRSIMCLMLILTITKTEVARSNNTDCDSRANSSTAFSV